MEIKAINDIITPFHKLKIKEKNIGFPIIKSIKILLFIVDSFDMVLIGTKLISIKAEIK